MRYLIGAASAALVLASASMAFAGSGNPASDVGSATATVISPLTVTHVDDLVFGKIVQAAGTATIAASSGASVQLSGLTAPGGQTTKPAKFTVTGDGTSAWTATVSPLTSLSDGASHTLGFAETTSTLTGSPANVYVGGTLTILATSTPASYTGSITVSASYD